MKACATSSTWWCPSCNRAASKEDYAPGTLREKLFGAGAARLPASHPAASHRPGRAG